MNGIFYYQESNSLYLLRFYEDYTVIGVTTSATLSEMSIVLSWFDKENSRKSYSEGKYTLTDSNKIHFILKSSEGEVEYKGEVLKNQEIKLSIHSHINNYRYDETYILYEQAINSGIKSNKKKV